MMLQVILLKNFKYKGEDSINKYLEFLIVKYGISFKKWYFGHHHRDIRIKDFSCLYHTIEFFKWRGFIGENMNYTFYAGLVFKQH